MYGFSDVEAHSVLTFGIFIDGRWRCVLVKVVFNGNWCKAWGQNLKILREVFRQMKPESVFYVRNSAVSFFVNLSFSYIFKNLSYICEIRVVSFCRIVTEVFNIV